MVGCLNPWGNRIERSEWGAEINCSLVVTCGWSWSWRSRWRTTWRVNSLGDFGAISRRSIGRYTRQTSLERGITYFRSYLHRWSTLRYDGDLNVEELKLEVWKNSEIKWIQLIFRWGINLWWLPEIFPKLYWLLHQFHRDEKFWG